MTTIAPPADDKLVRRVCPFQVKADSINEDERTFEGLTAVFNDIDLGDDRIIPGAFAKTIRRWKKSGQAMPLLNSHNHFDIMAALGQALDAKETKDGVWSKWEVIDGPDGDAALLRLRPSARTGKAVIGSMSIGYRPIKVDFEDSNEARFGTIRNIKELDWEESSLVLFPMAPGALIDVGSVKMLLERKLATREQLAEMTRLSTDLSALLEAAEEPDESDPLKSQPTAPVLLDEPDFTPLAALRVQQLRQLARRS